MNSDCQWAPVQPFGVPVLPKQALDLTLICPLLLKYLETLNTRSLLLFHYGVCLRPTTLFGSFFAFSALFFCPAVIVCTFSPIELDLIGLTVRTADSSQVKVKHRSKRSPIVYPFLLSNLTWIEATLQSDKSSHVNLETIIKTRSWLDPIFKSSQDETNLKTPANFVMPGCCIFLIVKFYYFDNPVNNLKVLRQFLKW